MYELGCILQQVPVGLKQIEDRIRNAVNAKKVRCTEFFKDFDRLRTGYITSKLKIDSINNIQVRIYKAVLKGHFLP